MVVGRRRHWATRRLSLLALCGVAAVSLSSCTGSDGGGSLGSTKSDEAATPGGEIPPAGGDWDLDYAELLRLHEAQLDDLAAQMMIDDPPEVPLVRFVSSEDWPQAQADCLAGSGFSFEVSQGGIGVVGDVPPEQTDALNLAVYRCSVMYPADPRTQIPLPRVRAEMQYRYWVDTVAPCVRAQGIDPGEPPSLQVWLDQYYVNPPAWDPFDAAAGSEEQLNLLYEVCPRDAPDLYPPVPH